MADSSTSPSAGNLPALPAGVSLEVHDRMLERLTALLEILLAEREALTGTVPDALHEIIARKEAVCAEVAHQQDALLAGLAPHTTLPDSMSELRALAQRCQQENALNGRIANRAKRTSRTLLAILTGDSSGDLYEKPGAERAPGSSTASGHRLGSA